MSTYRIEGTGIKSRKSRTVSFGANKFKDVLDRLGWNYDIPTYECPIDGKIKQTLLIVFTKEFVGRDSALAGKLELERALNRLGAGFRWDSISVVDN